MRGGSSLQGVRPDEYNVRLNAEHVEYGLLGAGDCIRERQDKEPRAAAAGLKVAKVMRGRW